MNYPSAGYVPPHGGEPSRAPKFLVPIILGTIALFIGLAVWGGITLFHSAAQGTSEATRVGDQFLGLMKNHDYADARALMIPEAQDATSVSSMQIIQDTVEKLHGKLLSWNKAQWFIQDNNGVAYVRLTYDLTCSKGKSSVTLVLQGIGGGKYGIRSYNYEL